MTTEILVDRKASHREDFTSSSVDIVGYDAETKTLYIEFHSSGTVYSYEGVEESTYDMFISADSVGSFYVKHIKGKFTAGPTSEDVIELRSLAQEEYTPKYKVGDRVLISYDNSEGSDSDGEWVWDGPATITIADDYMDDYVCARTDNDGRAMKNKVGGFHLENVEPLDESAEVDLKPDTKWASVPEGETPKFALGGSTGPSINISASGISINILGVKSKFGVRWTNGTLTFEPQFEAFNEADALRQFNEAIGQVMPDADVKVQAVTHYLS